MRGLRRFLIRLTAFATARRDDERLREELEDHLALQTADNIKAGLSPAEARRQAVLKFGAVEAIKDDYRDEQGLPVLDTLVQDVRYALRQLRKAPLFTLTATLSLAMGIGANAAVFTVIERVLLRPLAAANPHELVVIADQRIAAEASPRFSYPFYESLRDNGVLAGVAARFSTAINAAIDGHTAKISGELVSGSYFGVLGVSTQIGRPLTPEDDRTPGAHAVAVISDGLWKRSFASDPAVLGRDVRVNNHSFRIIGVAARGAGASGIGTPTDIWLPMTMQREVGRDFLADARTNWVEIVGRLNSGASPERAGAELTAYLDRSAPQLQADFPARQLLLVPADNGNSPIRRELAAALRVLLALTGLALVLACVNVAGLLAVRSAAREKEIAVRLAIGARRSRLTWQFLTESLLLAAIGGTAGLLMAPWAARMLAAAQPYGIEIDASLNLRVFLFGLVVSVLTAVCIAQAPILLSRKVGLTQAFGNPAAASASRRPTLHDLIVTFQIATSLAMLISAALLTQSLRSLQSVDPGFRADDLLLVSVDPKSSGYDGNRVEVFWRDALARVSRLREVQSVSLAGTVPLAPGRQRQPWTNAASGEKVEIDTNFVGPRYFATLDIPLVRGREFEERDGRTTRPVVIVNERLAAMFWPEQNPIGKGVRLPGKKDGPLAEVVGVVKDAKYRDLRGDTGPMIYRPALQTGSTDAMTLHVRAAGNPRDLAGAIRGEIQSLDRTVPLSGITTLDDILNASFGQTRQAALLAGVFGVLALVLSGIGVYGVTALAVSRRTRDIGIRMALGAQPGDVVRVIGRRAVVVVMAGLVMGLLGSFGFTRLAGSLLFGVTASDSATFAGMSALLAVVSAIAFAVPVRTATRLDAMAAIRYE